MRARIAPPQASLFGPTRSEQVARARERYFEEGLVPSGLVSDAVFQSWARCQRLHSAPGRKVAFEPVSASRAQLALQKNRELHAAWLQELPHLEAVLGTTSSGAMLTDSTGVLIGATCVGRSHERLMPLATRMGVNLSEEAVGTTAPGVAARSGQPVTVLGAEHFFDDVREMHCAAAPIRDARGELAGVLDISSEKIPFCFDAASVVGVYASALENRLLVSQSREHLVVRFQVAPSMLDSPLAGLVGLDTSGRIAWRNGAAARLLGSSLASFAPEPQSAEDAMACRFADLASLPANGAAVLRLPNGLVVWARAEMRAPDGLRRLVQVGPAREPEPPSDAARQPQEVQQVQLVKHRLRDLNRDLITRTLSEAGGNVSKAAETLGVSRGLIYRRLRDDGDQQR